MKKLIRIIPIMIVVFTIALMMLDKDYAEVEASIRLLIALGASIFSGIISYFLFPGKDPKADPFPERIKKPAGK